MKKTSIMKKYSFTMLLCEFGNENDLNVVTGRYQETLSNSFKVLTTSAGLWMLAIQSKGGKVDSDISTAWLMNSMVSTGS